MGIEDETDRTLFIRNLDGRVTEELLFELFLQAGPLIKTKIPKDAEGKPKTFGFAVFKHEVSVPYAMQLLDGTSLFGRSIHVQFRSGSIHGSSPGNSHSSSPHNPHGQRTPAHFSSPPQMHRHFASPDNLQKHVMMNMMWQLHLLNDGFPKSQQRQMSGHPGGRDSRQHDNAPYRRYPSQMNRNQRYADDAGYHQHHGHSRNTSSHPNARSNRHYDGSGSSRHHDDWGSRPGYQDSRWRRY